MGKFHRYFNKPLIIFIFSATITVLIFISKHIFHDIRNFENILTGGIRSPSIIDFFRGTGEVIHYEHTTFIFLVIFISVSIISLSIMIFAIKRRSAWVREEEQIRLGKEREEEQIRLEKDIAKAEYKKRQNEMRVQQEEMRRAEEEKLSQINQHHLRPWS